MRNLLLAAVLLIAAAAVYAQTPDGGTPANEGVCDDLMWATPGLYGLCIAFCEAQDLHDMDAENPDSIRSTVPKVKILENYNRKKQAGDPEMPCVQVPIPCWTQEEIDTIGMNGGTIRIYRHQDYNCPGWREGETWYVEERGPNPSGGEYQIWAGAWYRTDTGEQGCWYWDTLADPDKVRSFLTTQEEYEAARDSIRAHAEDVLGWGLWETNWPRDAPCP